MAGPLILVVEDNQASMRLMSVMLNLAKCPYVSATTVQEARERIAAAQPTLVFMDIQVPGGGGELLLQEIRSNAALASTKVFAMTAFSMEGDCQRFLSIGFDGYFSKPIDTKQIRGVIRQHMEEIAGQDLQPPS